MKPAQILYEKFFSAWPSFTAGTFFSRSDRCAPKSAADLFLPQPAPSRSIRALETELGLPLFDRLGRSSELTPFGRQALARARELLQSADDLRGSGRLASDDQAGVLRIGMGSGPGVMLMTPLQLQTAQERPRFRMEIARGRTDLLVQALRDRSWTP